MIQNRFIHLSTLAIVGLGLASCAPPDGQGTAESVASEADRGPLQYRDFGNDPFVFNIEDYTKGNDTFRTALWTGEYMQLTVMSLLPGEDVGLEVHSDHDQFIRIEEGEGLVRMGDAEDDLPFERRVQDDFVIMIPAGKWHNVINDSDRPLKLYSIYAPREHERGTVHKTRKDAMADEHDQ